ncbi:DUF3794 and LysM peptidoglycan-binding domain-containing protein [Hathewaya histolytica]|uniref:DUF3794 and LysM peptidoglycan-binding domain-containing protein n=1 Tax=Hathewaya histolytica TaxID=1498 RepID=UPI003B683331
MELIKENIEYEQLLGENYADTVLRDEYVIPDTHPDVEDILLLDARPRVSNIQVLQDKVFIEGVIDYNLMYVNKGEEASQVHAVKYTKSFTNSIDCNGATSDMNCEAACFVEHMECNIVNERKVCIEGIVKLKSEVYNKYNYEIVKDIKEAEEVQFWRNPILIDKVIDNISTDLMGECSIKIPMEKPQVSKIINWDANFHKKDVKILDGKLKLELWAKIKILYQAPENFKDIYTLEEDIFIEKDLESRSVNEDMNNFTSYDILDLNYSIKEDDLGENRILDIVLMGKANTRVTCKEELKTIEDAYCPNMILNMEKKQYNMNIIHDQVTEERVIKGDVELDSTIPRPREIIFCKATLNVTDKKLVEDRVVVDGIINVNVLYKSDEEGKETYSIEDQIPFNTAMDIEGTKIHMQSLCRMALEDVEAEIRGGNISIKAIVQLYVRVNYMEGKEFLVHVEKGEGEVPKKKASIIIYSVQPGDTLWKIAKRYNTTIETISKVNEIEDVNNIKVGSKLIIPGRAII